MAEHQIGHNKRPRRRHRIRRRPNQAYQSEWLHFLRLARCARRQRPRQGAINCSRSLLGLSANLGSDDSLEPQRIGAPENRASRDRTPSGYTAAERLTRLRGANSLAARFRANSLDPRPPAQLLRRALIGGRRRARLRPIARALIQCRIVFARTRSVPNLSTSNGSMRPRASGSAIDASSRRQSRSSRLVSTRLDATHSSAVDERRFRGSASAVDELAPGAAQAHRHRATGASCAHWPLAQQPAAITKPRLAALRARVASREAT